MKTTSPQNYLEHVKNRQGGSIDLSVGRRTCGVLRIYVALLHQVNYFLNFYCREGLFLTFEFQAAMVGARPPHLAGVAGK